MKKIKYCDYDSWGHITALHFLCNLQTSPISKSITLHLVAKSFKVKKLQLIGTNYMLQRKWNAVNMTQGVIFTTVHFLRNLQMGPKSKIFALHWSGKASQVRTLQLIGLIHKSRRKWNVANTTQGSYSQQFIFSVTYKQPNKRDFYITLIWKGLSGGNTPAYWANS
jgi:hypothetical protein